MDAKQKEDEILRLRKERGLLTKTYRNTMEMDLSDETKKDIREKTAARLTEIHLGLIEAGAENL